jgi:hypothetical protein
MKAKNCLCVGLICAVAGTTSSALAGGGDLKLADRGIKVEPVRLAKAKMGADRMAQRAGEWVNYGGSTRVDTQTEFAFDCWEPNPADGFPWENPDYGTDCGMGTSRWYFGTAYCNMFATNDMTVADGFEGGQSERVGYAWYWTCGGSGTEPCLVALFTADNFDDTCTGPDASGTYSGVIYDFGTLTCNPGGYYFTDVDLKGSGLFHQLPTDGEGAYLMFLLQSSTTLATCGQPMLWGTKAGNPSFQGPIQWDDDNPISATHEAPTECYTYDQGGATCPDPLGATVAFYGAGGGDDCPPSTCADYDGNGTVNTLDFIAFLNDFNSQDPCADYTGEGTINTLDFITFLNAFNNPGDC